MVGVWRLMFHDIESGAADPAFHECMLQSFFVDKFSSRRIDQKTRGFHFAQRLRIDDVACPCRERQMKRDKIGTAHQLP